MVSDASPVTAGLFGGSDEFGPYDWADPWPTYDRMRTEAPVWRNPEGDWVLTRHADCEAVLRDHRFSSNNKHADPPRQYAEGDLRALLEEEDQRTMLFMDPPDHTRLRKLVSKGFTPRTVERLRPRIQELVDGILDEAADAGSLDVVTDLGFELPVTVICEMLGVPVDDRDHFAGWSSDASRLLDNDIDAALLQRGMEAAFKFVAYFQELFAERRARPADDLVSALLAVEEQGDRLSEDELTSTVMLLFVAGHETTMNLIGNGTYALLRDRDQLRRWQQDPALDVPGIEELLRFEGPVHVTGRVATEDLEVGGQPIAKGTSVVTLLAAANRDPARFADPAHLDVGRADNHHLAFSQGLHYCLGAALARLEGQIAVGTLVRRFPDLDLAQEPAYRDHFVLRGLTALHVTV